MTNALATKQTSIVPGLVHPRSLLSIWRMDVAVKWRFFRFADADSERVYRWHIDKRRESNKGQNLGMDGAKQTTDQYVEAARALYTSMHNRGYDPSKPIPVDPYGSILGGAHRLACALALDIDEVPVQQNTQPAWAPPWGFRWFCLAGMADADRHRMLDDWETLWGCR